VVSRHPGAGAAGAGSPRAAPPGAHLPEASATRRTRLS
jgi:hypothetical protein